MISFAEKEYIAKQKDAETKLMLLDKASVWIHNTISPEKVDLKKLSNNMVEYFKDLVLETYMTQNTLGLSPDKLIEAKEIDVEALWNIQKEYDVMKSTVQFKNNTPTIKVERRDFETWTTNQRQNTRLLAGNKLITALNELEKIHPTARMFCNRLTNGYVNWDMYRNGYYVNPEMLN